MARSSGIRGKDESGRLNFLGFLFLFPEKVRVRGFTGTGDVCDDLEFCNDTPISADDAVLKKTFASYRLDENYFPQFNDVFLYAQVLYQARMYKAAAPILKLHW